MLVETIAAVASISAGVGILAAAVSEVLSWRRRQQQQGKTAETTVEQRIDRLTTTLNQAARTMQQIETEMNERRRLVDQLREDVETYNRLKELNQEQIEAITQVVENAATGEARRSSRAALRSTSVSSFSDRWCRSPRHSGLGRSQSAMQGYVTADSRKLTIVTDWERRDVTLIFDSGTVRATTP